MISDPNPTGGKASLDDIITLLATKAGARFMVVLLAALDQQISRVERTNKVTGFIDYERFLTKKNFERKKKSKIVYEQTFLYKEIPIVMVEFSNNWTIHKLKLKA